VSGADYRESGVDLEEGDRATALMGEAVRSTFDDRVLSDVGLFGGLFRAEFPGVEEAVLVASTDGVGTKLKVASMAGSYGTVGMDLVNHCTDDILVQGARPLFFLDYIACGRLEAEVAAEIVTGLASACRANGCALLGGETAEMPGFYGEGDYDVAGTIVGVVDRGRIVDGSGIRPGMRLIGLPSSGLHTNGYSLARKVLFGDAGLHVDSRPGALGGATVGEALLAVHKSYLAPVSRLLERPGLVAGLCHVTGGGIPGNLSRILPDGCGAVVRTGWKEPPVFGLISSLGGVERGEMFRAFNMGVGLIAAVADDGCDDAMEILEGAGAAPFPCGSVVRGEGVRIEEGVS
jgi:phosphoribosylformylglycinamidine cyclo-ligase